VAECVEGQSLALKVPGLRQVVRGIFQKLSAHSTGNEYPGLFRAGEGEANEEEEWHPSSVTPFAFTSRLSNRHFPHLHNDNLFNFSNHIHTNYAKRYSLHWLNSISLLGLIGKETIYVGKSKTKVYNAEDLTLGVPSYYESPFIHWSSDFNALGLGGGQM